MKIALCFLISYEQKVNKEHIWREWIEHNKDIINVYFHYKDYNTIQSPWIKKHAIPPEYIVKTSYYHVVPAYFSIMHFAIIHDKDNAQFCFLTDACIPIISPEKFRENFMNHHDKTIMNWKPAWWNVYIHKRANLRLFQPEFRLGNDPWFIINRIDAKKCILYSNVNKDIYNKICQGGLANESIFAIILYSMASLKNVIKEVTHCADWSRMSSKTSPHIFREGSKKDVDYIHNFLKENKYTMFLRKVSPDFPDDLIRTFLYQ